jgi:hypothetical protein
MLRSSFARGDAGTGVNREIKRVERPRSNFIAGCAAGRSKKALMRYSVVEGSSE